MRRLGPRPAFTLLLLASAVVVVAGSLTLSPVARRAPLTVGVVTLGLLAAQLLVDLVPALEARFRPFEGVDVFGVERIRQSLVGPRARAGSPPESAESAVLGWVALLLGAILLFGLLPGLTLHSAAYLRRAAGLRLATAVAVVVGVAAALHAVFGAALGYPLYDGLVWTGLRALA